VIEKGGRMSITAVVEGEIEAATGQEDSFD